MFIYWLCVLLFKICKLLIISIKEHKTYVFCNNNFILQHVLGSHALSSYATAVKFVRRKL